MNYLKEINAFHASQETEPLTIAAAYLWIVLMDINNRAGWREQFSVAATLLCAKTSLKEGTFKRARRSKSLLLGYLVPSENEKIETMVTNLIDH